MTDIYLHIGTRKTGSTTLQWFLAQNREKLLSYGYLYPLAGQPSHMPGHHQLAWKFKQDLGIITRSPDNKDIQNVWRELHQEIQQYQPKVVIISTETFSGFSPQGIELVKKELSLYPTHIIVYLREQEDYLRSLYCQWVRRNKKLNWHSKKKAWDMLMEEGDYLTMLSRWEQLFGKENIIVKGFEKSCQSPGLEKSILQATGLDVDVEQFSLVNKKNKSLNIKVIKVMRWCNYFAHLLEQLSLPTDALFSLYVKILSNSKYWPTKLILNAPDSIISSELFTPDEKQFILKNFTDMNEKISEYYLPSEEHPLFPNKVT